MDVDLQSTSDVLKEFLNRSLGSKIFSVPKSSALTTSSSSTIWQRYYGSLSFSFFFNLPSVIFSYPCPK